MYQASALHYLSLGVRASVDAALPMATSERPVRSGQQVLVFATNRRFSRQQHGHEVGVVSLGSLDQWRAAALRLKVYVRATINEERCHFYVPVAARNAQRGDTQAANRVHCATTSCV